MLKPKSPQESFFGSYLYDRIVPVDHLLCKINPGWMNGVYEVDYIKQNGKWKMFKVHRCMTFHCPYTIGFVEPERQATEVIF